MAEKLNTDYRELIRQQALLPLGMRSSDFFGFDSERQLAQGYDEKGQAVVHRRDVAVLGACCAGRSSARDLIRFLGAQIEPEETPFGRAIGQTQRKLARRSLDRPGRWAGLGWHIDASGLLFKQGGGRGFSSFVAVHPERKQAVAVLIAQEGFLAQDIGRSVLRALSLNGAEGQAPADAVQSRLPARVERVDAQFEGGVHWLGYRLDRSEVTAGETVGVEFFYRADTPVAHDWMVFVHADHQNERMRLNADHYPVRGLFAEEPAVDSEARSTRAGASPGGAVSASNGGCEVAADLALGPFHSQIHSSGQIALEEQVRATLSDASLRAIVSGQGRSGRFESR